MATQIFSTSVPNYGTALAQLSRSASRGFVVLALGFVMNIAQAGEFNSDKIGDVLRDPRGDHTLCAHRGLCGNAVGNNSENPSVRDIPENSGAAIQAATYTEIDVRSTQRGDLIMLYDTNLGRTTNVGTKNGKRDCDPSETRQLFES
ncbi:hypothetical protein EH240_31135 [Mesorhizobium tamadayense]|uniref:GP-PDE domain-containing protein n=1 Tax=Mesorhizobium tamadayense TaxID=425306 RepID=A0A3P3F0J0_9HYPH|nr:hypothetical protein [Mesorhizobium tamadayense]RRH92163.1 hypothetical protein EH240_31135 [Mesorhizobium tamadayense]